MLFVFNDVAAVTPHNLQLSICKGFATHSTYHLYAVVQEKIKSVLYGFLSRLNLSLTLASGLRDAVGLSCQVSAIER